MTEAGWCYQGPCPACGADRATIHRLAGEGKACCPHRAAARALLVGGTALRDDLRGIMERPVDVGDTATLERRIRRGERPGGRPPDQGSVQGQ